MEEAKTTPESKTPPTPKTAPNPETKAASKTAATPRTSAPKASTTGAVTPKTAKPPAKPIAQPQGSPKAKPIAEKQDDIVLPAPKKVPEVTDLADKKKSKKLAKAFGKLKIQKKEIASLEKNRDRLMKDLISAIEKKKKNKKIRSLARDLNRIDKRVNNLTASYMQANKKLTNKMEKGKS